MVKKEEIFSKALDIKKTALEEKSRLHNLEIASAYKAEPRLSEIDREFSSTGASVAMTALSGDSKTLAALREKLSALKTEKESLLKKAKIKEIKYDCAICEDTGYIHGKLCECVKTLAKQLTFEQLSSEMPLGASRFDNFDLTYYPDTADEHGVTPRKKMTAVLKLCREYAINFNPNTSESLLFLGGAGLGKTHLTLAIVSGVIEKGYDVVYGSAYNLLSAVEKEHFSNGGTDSYDGMLECALLVIDDLGTEFTSPYTLSVLYNLINSRILMNKPTIINTNLSLSEIEKRYTPRIASRLIGCFKAKMFFGKDIRQLKSMEK